MGHGLDDWAARLARGAGVPRLVAVDAGIRLRRVNDGPGGSVDPHYWLSASNGKLMLGVGSVLAGLGASYRLDVPSGPAVVAIAGIVFLAAWARVAWQARGGSERTSA